MKSLSNLFLNSEQEYIEEFCKAYKDPIKTSDGFTVYCNNINQRAHHFCCGTINKFQPVRAQRILWAKYILLNPEERTILGNVKDKNSLLFFMARKRDSYLVICRVINDKDLDLISGYPVFGKKSEDYKKPNFPYKFI